MARRDDRFTTIRSEGGLLPPDLLARVAEADRDLPGLTPEAYHLGPDERVGEAITRSWTRLLGAWQSFRDALAQDADGAATGLTRQRWSLLVFQELGFGSLQPAPAVEVEAKAYPVSHRWGSVPIHLVGARVGLDERTAGVAGAARVSPHGLVQELLNRSDDHLWGMVSNGLRLRLLHDHASLTRQAFVEFDLEAMFEGQVYADFALCWLVCHASRFEGDPPEKCLLEQWRLDAAQRGTRALEQLRVGVEEAITALGSGFLAHRANRPLRDALRGGSLAKHDYYRQLLRLVYRLLFLAVAEARDLLHVPDADATTRERYAAYYSLARLRRLAEVRRGSAHGDLWAGLQVVFAGLGADTGLPALGLPALGSFLWSAQATPDLDGAALANEHLLAAVRALSTVRQGSVTRSVDYRNLGAEELGSVYESLLELHPDVDVDARTFRLVTAGGHERKTTGSYYTPTSLIDELLDSALDPVLAEKAAAPDPEAAILALTVLDPACGSGHFLIAAAHRIAQRLASVRAGGAEPSPGEVRTALRDVIGRCLHGIDVNPMAVELCKVSLWMEAVEPGKPLSFLEHRIVCGDALLGTTPDLMAAGVPDDAFKPLTGDDKPTVTALKRANKKEREGQQAFAFGPAAAALVAPVADAVAAIDALDDASAEQVRAKQARFDALARSAELRRARLAADAWCAAFVAEKVPGAPVLTDAVVRRLADDPDTVDPDVLATVERLADEYRFCHWHLAFPDVYGPDGPGGFDVVLGNPPWEKVKLSKKEFFAARDPEIAKAAGARRKAMIARLAADDPALWAKYRAALRRAEGESHLLRSSGRYPLCGRGDVNTYAVFAEAMRDVLGPRGRLGVIVPTGIATDDTTKHFFADCVDAQRLVSLYDFENHDRLFPDVDSRMKFCLLTLAGREARCDAAEFVFFAHQTSDLADPQRRFTLSPADIALINPNTRTAPVFRTRRDAEITKAIYRRVPVLVRDGEPDGNPWGVEFSTMFHMTNDSHLFRTAAELSQDGATLGADAWTPDGRRWLPIFEGKMISLFDHRNASIMINPNNALRQQQSAAATDKQKTDPRFRVAAYLWAPASEVVARSRRVGLGWTVGFKRVTSPTNWRTMIGCVLPVAGVSYTLYVTNLDGGARASMNFLILANSFAFDYFLRQKTTQSSLPMGVIFENATPPPRSLANLTDALGDSDWLILRGLELTYTAWDLAGFAADLGYDGPPFRFDPARRELLRAELDAACFHLYGLERDDVDYVMDTFPIVRRKDEAAHGEYRTKRLVLEVYDAMTEAIDTADPYQTILDPPPAHPSAAHPPT